ncbi:MAG TPA: DUF3501 family protein [Stellaceae bacterium]|jgi:hypothetical protein|nr:DUF3501 family protein [Stellaceae bacterium]
MATTTGNKHEITRADILDPAAYAKDRRELKKRISELKRDRRVEIGPFVTFYFESYDTMWHQIHEMLYIEKGGEQQIVDELEAYNPLIPKGEELIATVMIEIEDAMRRERVLATLGGIEEKMFISVGGERIAGIPDPTRENTSPEGKASSVQFMRFPFTAAQVAKFRAPGAQVLVGIDHANYGHIAVMPERVRHALAGDFA